MSQHLRQHLTRPMEQHDIGKNAVEALGGQFEVQEVLLQHLAAAVGARPGPQPKSSRSKGGGPGMCLSSAAMFWLTSWSRVPSH
ncbi:MAG: hypothetical protein A3E25_06875 [Burkholderiales bacterium RIFCSPHIGHO2_12_FULL_69_20]|nr:MAG: hypothetical protein A3E25_06875 [Burkholderiales bacterium RIFCSPHIGHO2_12_FULL_69_20]